MRPPFSASEFIRRAREAQHDSLGLDHDVDSTVSLANVARGRFLVQPSLQTLTTWESLVDEVGSLSTELPEDAAAPRRWLAVESIRLGAMRKELGAVEESTHARSSRWAYELSPDERTEIVRAIRGDLVRLRVATAASTG